MVLQTHDHPGLPHWKKLYFRPYMILCWMGGIIHDIMLNGGGDHTWYYVGGEGGVSSSLCVQAICFFGHEKSFSNFFSCEFISMVFSDNYTPRKWCSICTRHTFKWTSQGTFRPKSCQRYIFNKLFYKRFGLVPIDGTLFCHRYLFFLFVRTFPSVFTPPQLPMPSPRQIMSHPLDVDGDWSVSLRMDPCLWIQTLWLH